jgi:hypothetical protein
MGKLPQHDLLAFEVTVQTGTIHSLAGCCEASNRTAQAIKHDLTDLTIFRSNDSFAITLLPLLNFKLKQQEPVD